MHDGRAKGVLSACMQIVFICFRTADAGLGLRVEGHLWIPEDSFCYEMQGTPQVLEVLPFPLVHYLCCCMQLDYVCTLCCSPSASASHAGQRPVQ